MVTPTLIQIIYWLAMIATIIGGIAFISREGSAIAVGFLYLTLGPLAIRVYADMFIVICKMHENFADIKRSLLTGGFGVRGTFTLGQGPRQTWHYRALLLHLWDGKPTRRAKLLRQLRGGPQITLAPIQATTEDTKTLRPLSPRR